MMRRLTRSTETTGVSWNVVGKDDASHGRLARAALAHEQHLRKCECGGESVGHSVCGQIEWTKRSHAAMLSSLIALQQQAIEGG
jgi:hypothetical protein